jgi:diadenosine tetraphosphatase ApaH/serine/threonine PP2A family protein phosphatase
MHTLSANGLALKLPSQIDVVNLTRESLHFSMEFRDEVRNMVRFIIESAKEMPDPASRIEDSFACRVISAGSLALMDDPAVLELTKDWIIVGDIHGDLISLLRIFSHLGWPPARSYLFLGDYVDRGSNSCEVILLLYALKYLYPADVVLLRGNHEFAPMTEVYGFRSEARSKLSEAFYLTAVSTFDDLPIAAVLNGEALCVHGGISPGLATLNDLRKVGKVDQWTVRLDDCTNELLWSDPCDSVSDFSPSSRGCGFMFGAEATRAFLERSDLRMIIRAHELCLDGFQWHFGQTVLTLFSTCDYCQNANHAAAAIYSAETGLDFAVFEMLGPLAASMAPDFCGWPEEERVEKNDETSPDPEPVA